MSAPLVALKMRFAAGSAGRRQWNVRSDRKNYELEENERGCPAGGEPF
jgi:hypothetical protein